MIGAGPAGSVAAHTLATRGASVLLVDRARFPRDKPCGGGVTLRAARALPFPIDPVVEDVIDRLEVRLRFGSRWERLRSGPLAVMTRRSRLDAFLAERAASAGADFRDGVRVTGVRADGPGVAVRIGGETLHAEAVVGADGVNGVTARALRLCERPAYGVALEGNVPYGPVERGRYAGRIVFELGLVRGGYGWVFPKGDHVNVGVGGWARAAPRLRAHLARLCHAHGLRVEDVLDVRGYRLPVRRPDALLARGRGVVVGDAAGLIDPFAGDGIYEAFVSGAVAADAVVDVLAGRSRDLSSYDARVKAVLRRSLMNAWAAKAALECLPRLMFTVARAERVQRALERLARGDAPPAESRLLATLGEKAVGALGSASHALATRPRGR